MYLVNAIRDKDITAIKSIGERTSDFNLSKYGEISPEHVLSVNEDSQFLSQSIVNSFVSYILASNDLSDDIKFYKPWETKDFIDRDLPANLFDTKFIIFSSRNDKNLEMLWVQKRKKRSSAESFLLQPKSPRLCMPLSTK